MGQSGQATSLLAAAGKEVGIRPSGGRLAPADESALLHAFLSAVWTSCAKTARGRSPWIASPPTRRARRAGNFDFSGPVDTAVKSATLWPGLGLVDSQAPVCKLALVGKGPEQTLQVTGDVACTTRTIPTSLPGHPVTATTPAASRKLRLRRAGALTFTSAPLTPRSAA